MENKNMDRHLELSAKLIEMGASLRKEGDENKDFMVSQLGVFMTTLGGIMFSEKDVIEFGILCSMFSAKKVLENMETKNPRFFQDLKEDKAESYDDLIKRINDLRKNNGLGPIQE